MHNKFWYINQRLKNTNNKINEYELQIFKKYRPQDFKYIACKPQHFRKIQRFTRQRRS